MLDFGIAKMSALDEGGSRLTRTGMIFGTPEYMSPEQAKGDRPDHRVDIYAVGCILYEMLTGDVPFHAETFMGVLTKHMFENPEPPSHRNPHANIPADLEAVCLKALAKDRDQRYQTMKELALALETCAGGDLSQAWGNEPSGVGAGLREPSQTFRTPGSVAAGAVGAVGTAPPRSSSSPELTPAKSRVGLGVVAGVVGVLLVGGTAAVLLTRAKPVPPKPAVTAPAVLPKPKPVVAARPVEPAKPTHFTMSINTRPVGAEVFEGAERLGVTPCNVVLAASEQTVELQLKKKGWRDETLKIVPDKDHDFLADLQPASRPHAPSTRAAKSTAPVVAAPPTLAPKPEAPKPAGKLRDLKDPFAN